MSAITAHAVTVAVAAHYGIPIGDLRGPRRHKSRAHARAVAMYLARQLTRTSFPELGRAFGGRHHSTVIAAVHRVGMLIRDDAMVFAEIAALTAQLRSGAQL